MEGDWRGGWAGEMWQGNFEHMAVQSEHQNNCAASIWSVSKDTTPNNSNTQ